MRPPSVALQLLTSATALRQLLGAKTPAPAHGLLPTVLRPPSRAQARTAAQRTPGEQRVRGATWQPSKHRRAAAHAPARTQNHQALTAAQRTPAGAKNARRQGSPAAPTSEHRSCTSTNPRTLIAPCSPMNTGEAKSARRPMAAQQAQAIEHRPCTRPNAEFPGAHGSPTNNRRGQRAPGVRWQPSKHLRAAVRAPARTQNH